MSITDLEVLYICFLEIYRHLLKMGRGRVGYKLYTVDLFAPGQCRICYFCKSAIYLIFKLFIDVRSWSFEMERLFETKCQRVSWTFSGIWGQWDPVNLNIVTILYFVCLNSDNFPSFPFVCFFIRNPFTN